jgi:hypothetical protein
MVFATARLAGLPHSLRIPQDDAPLEGRGLFSGRIG